MNQADIDSMTDEEFGKYIVDRCEVSISNASLAYVIHDTSGCITLTLAKTIQFALDEFPCQMKQRSAHGINSIISECLIKMANIINDGDIARLKIYAEESKRICDAIEEGLYTSKNK